MTCCGWLTFMALITAALGAIALAMLTARSASVASFAVPLSTTCSLALATRMPGLSMLDWMLSAMCSASMVTSTSMTVMSCFSLSNTETLVVPTFLPWM